MGSYPKDEITRVVTGINGLTATSRDKKQSWRQQKKRRGFRDLFVFLAL
jgi:hypothetical protein